jgi:diguanylate cyclase (GGDEF)-like protein/PAS domain S-box-containing protein
MSGLREHEETTGSDAWYRSLLTNISDTVSICDADTRLLYTTGAANQVLGYSEAFWTGSLPIELVHPDDRARIIDAWQASLRQPRQEVATEVRMRAADGTWQDISVTGVNLLDDPSVGGIVITSRNITALRRAERLASSQAAVLELIARGEPMSTVAAACIRLLEENGVSGAASIYLLEGERLELRSGRAPASVQGWVREPVRTPDRSLCDAAISTRAAVIVEDLTVADVHEDLRAIVEEEGIRSAWSLPIASIATGDPVGSLSVLDVTTRVPSSLERQVADAACSLIAIALERERTEARLAHQALHDALTGLPNRALLVDRMDQALARRVRAETDVALLFCDIDRFKVINDSLGHNVGDQLLVAFAERLRSVIAPGDTIARFGGDEFVVLLEDLDSDDQPIHVAEELAATLERPFLLPAGKEVYLTVSIGLARAADHPTADDWLRDADAAMYRAKEEGRNRLAQFDTEMRDAAVARLQVEHDLRRAVDRGELVVHYQPVVDLRSGRIVGVEALVRWQHPERGLLSPNEFIAVAEDIGTIGDLGRHVLEVAVASCASIASTRDRPFQLGVNISARQLTSGGLDRLVAATLARFDWPAEALLLEITETALIHGVRGPIQEMSRLQELGVSLAIDDFGTGYSSLARLGHLPVDQVKIDQSFVAAIDRPEDRLERIVDAVIAIAGALDHRTTAEGVETQSQLDYLRRMRCDFAQGYLFSKPVTFEEFAVMLDDDPRW